MNNKEVIKTISYSQHEILSNIKILHNDNKPFDCDITYSKGCFYNDKTYPVEPPKHKFDVYPQTPDTVKIEPLGRIPLESNTVESIVVDLPFVISKGPSLKEAADGKKNLTAKRFSWYYPAIELYKSYNHWINEAYRVLKPNGLCVFKCQDTVSGGFEHNVSAFSVLSAMDCGFVVDDTFILLAKARMLSGKVEAQRHARKFHSYFFVFKKREASRAVKYNYIELIENLKML